MSTKNNTPLPQKVKNWIEEQGFSLEMRVAKVFRDAGFEVSQFKHFVDQESQSVRPVDVVAITSETVSDNLVSAQFFIECKYSNQPWVILITPQRFDKFSFFSRVLQSKHPSNWESIKSLQGRLVGSILKTLDKNGEIPELLSLKDAGYVVKRTMVEDSTKKPNDIAYQATVQVSKSVEAQDIENETIYLRVFEDADPNSLALPFTFIFPIIVISGKLFEGHLGKNEEIEVKEVDYGTVFVPYRQRETKMDHQVVLSAVTIVTETYLTQYAEDIKKAFQDFLKHETSVNNVVNFEKSKLDMEMPF